VRAKDIPGIQMEEFVETRYDDDDVNEERQPMVRKYMKYKFWEGGVDPNKVMQGSLADCYFLSPLSALAANGGDRIKGMFDNIYDTGYGVFVITLNKNGIKTQVVIDDWVPTIEGKVAFSNSRSGELWVILLEKAWAKLHGSYERIEAGMSHHSLSDLTGAPGYTYDMKEMTDEVLI
jgi:calpain-15